jgi:hypothetical protein
MLEIDAGRRSEMINPDSTPHLTVGELATLALIMHEGKFREHLAIKAEKLSRLGLIETNADGRVALTDKGEAHLNALCRVPLPKKTWVSPIYDLKEE